MTEATLSELDRRMQRLEHLMDSMDVDRERLSVSLAELAYSTEATLKVNKSQQTTLDATLKTLQSQQKYVISVIGLLVLQGGPELIGKIVKLVVSMHTGIDL